MSIIIYGIRNCDTMKKAFAWLEKHGVAYEFHDYKSAGVMKAELTRWCHAKGWETMLNRAGSAFRKLQDSDKQNLTQDKAIALMIGNPSIIKGRFSRWTGRSRSVSSRNATLRFSGP